MNSHFEVQREELTQRAGSVLHAHAIHNRSGLPPFHLPRVAQRLVAGLIQYTMTNNTATVQAIGRAVAQQGLALRSLLAVNSELTDLLFTQELPPAQQAKLVNQLNGYMTLLIESLAETEKHAVIQQRQEIEQALEQTLMAQQSQEKDLRQVIQELSTPIIPVYDSVLVLPLIGMIDTRRAQEITERLLTAIAEYVAEIVILDITGITVIDTSVANHLLLTARAARLLGTQVLLVGVSTEVAQTMVQLGVTLENIITRATLQNGLEYALQRRGLSIMPTTMVQSQTG
jgi:rsbT co-antagonist protein RsbR